MICYKCGKDTVQSYYVRLSPEPGKRTSKSMGYVCLNPQCDFSQKTMKEED